MTTTNGPTAATAARGSENFLKEGAASYVPATIAIREFTRIVQERCENIAAKRLDDITTIMGIKLSDEDLTHYPQKGKLTDPNDPWICISYSVKDVGRLHIGLYWESRRDGGYQLHAITALDFSDEKFFQIARDKFTAAGKSRLGFFPYGEEYHQITLSEPIPVEQAPSFDASVASVLTGFLKDWERIGGLKGLKEARTKSRK